MHDYGNLKLAECVSTQKMLVNVVNEIPSELLYKHNGNRSSKGLLLA